MSTKLEMRLDEYEKHSPVTTDEELAQAIAEIIESEESLPEAERDYDLIDEAIEAYISLNGTDIDELEKRADEVACAHVAKISEEDAERRSSKIIRLRRFLPLAAIISLIIVGSIVTSAVRNNLMNDKFTDLHDSFSSSADISSTGEYIEFASLEALCASNEYENAPKPQALPYGFTLRHISVQNSCLEVEGGYLVEYTLIDIEFISESGVQHIAIESPAFTFSSEGKLMEIGGREVYWREVANGYECAYSLRGHAITITAPTMETLRRTVVSIQ